LRIYSNLVTITGMNLEKWLAKITTDTAPEIAQRAGIPKRTVQHQISTGRMSIENLVKIGAAYGHHPLETLIDFEVIDPVWRTIPDIRAALRLAPEEWLADEVLNRMRAGAKTDEFTTPLDELIERKHHKANSSNSAPTPDISTEVDHDAIIEQINAGKVKFAAQKRTLPLEENTP